MTLQVLRNKFYLKYKDLIANYQKDSPTFKITDDVFVEVLDTFTESDRNKYKSLNNKSKIILIFKNPGIKIYEGSTISYGGWCRRQGIKCFSIKDEISIRTYLLRMISRESAKIRSNDLKVQNCNFTEHVWGEWSDPESIKLKDLHKQTRFCQVCNYEETKVLIVKPTIDAKFI